MKKSIICGALAAIFLLAPAVQAQDGHRARGWGQNPSRHHGQPMKWGHQNFNQNRHHQPAQWGHQNFNHNRHNQPPRWGHQQFNHNRHHRPPQWGQQNYRQGWGQRQAPWGHSQRQHGGQPQAAPFRPQHSYGAHQSPNPGWQHHPGGQTFQRAYSYDQ